MGQFIGGNSTGGNFPWVFFQEVIHKGAIHLVPSKNINKLLLKDDILYYKYHGKNLIVATKSFHSEIIQLSHSVYLSGHFGTFKTRQAILKRFWWSESFKDVEAFVQSCLICKKVKHSRRKESFMTKKTLPSILTEVISIDYLVDLPVTTRKNRHILVINDSFSKHINLYPVKNNTASTAARYLTDYALQFGIPSTVLSDQDPLYQSDQKVIRANQVPHMTKELRKAIMVRSKLKNKYRTH